jgi:ATP-dependent DNA helicase RecG
MGGLDRYLQRYFDKGINQKKLLSSLHYSVDFNYAELSMKDRREWIDKVLLHLMKIETKAVKKTASSITKSKTNTSRQSSKPPSKVIEKSLDSPITVLKGVPPTMAERFARLGVNTVQDMLYFFPNRHLDYTQVKPISELEVGTEQTTIATVWEAHIENLGSRKGTEALVSDNTGTIKVVWFNQPYLAKTLKTNTQIVLSGRIGAFKGSMVFQSPEWEILHNDELVHTGRLVPLYPLTRGLNSRSVRRLVKGVVEEWASQIPDFLPVEIRQHSSLLSLSESIMQAHYPDSEKMKSKARKRLAFDELFLIQLGVLSRKKDWQEEKGNSLKTDTSILHSFLGALPFDLTSAQKRAMDEILGDLEKEKPMCRLLQGDVGSGKTVIAAAALFMAAANGYQGAFMVPTEILAEQHFSNIAELLSMMGKLEESEKYRHIAC